MKVIARATVGNVIDLMACRCFGVGGRFVCELERLYIYIYLLSRSALLREGRLERGSNLMRRREEMKCKSPLVLVHCGPIECLRFCCCLQLCVAPETTRVTRSGFVGLMMMGRQQTFFSAESLLCLPP